MIEGSFVVSQKFGIDLVLLPQVFAGVGLYHFRHQLVHGLGFVLLPIKVVVQRNFSAISQLDVAAVIAVAAQIVGAKLQDHLESLFDGFESTISSTNLNFYVCCISQSSFVAS
ncbi:hypothetical protein D3C85_1514030 [compost metagenome]